MGLGSVGREILCFLVYEAPLLPVVLVLALGPSTGEEVDSFGFDALLPNHFDGFERN